MTEPHKEGHAFPDGAERCIHCGTLATLPGLTACPGAQGRGTERQLRPEPARRVYAVDDAEIIHGRLLERETERLEALNRPRAGEEDLL